MKATQYSGAVVIAYGQVINSVIKFLIVAFAVFLLIKQVNRFVRKKARPYPHRRVPRSGC